MSKPSNKHPGAAAALLALAVLSGSAMAALPKPALTPAQQEAAAAKKAAADAKAAKDKASLAASMDAVAARWRARAPSQGWTVHPAVAIAAAPAAASAAGSSAPIVGGGPAGQPQGQLTQAAAAAPVQSEKHGTAPPSEDVKPGPSKSQPAGAEPTVQKGSPDASKKR
jgi:hypothetical protein